MMFNHIMLWTLLIAPWGTLFFMKKDTIKRYMPVAIFVSLLVTILFEIAYVLKWWVLLDYIVPWGIITNVSFVYGTFLVGTIWIFRLTFRNFWVYLVSNVAIDGLFAFLLNDFFEGKIYSLVNFNEFQVFLLMVGLSITIFIYQKWQEGIYKEHVRLNESGVESDEFQIKLPLTKKREKIK